MSDPDRIISVFGSGKVGPDSDVFKLAEQTGAAIARAGFTIANGGYGGTMLASSRGAANAGGRVIGITCAAFKSSRPNEYVTENVVTETLDKRLDKLVELGDGYIVLPGGTGTLLELAMVWELKGKGFLPGNKPIVLVGGFWRPLVDLMASIDPDTQDQLYLAADAEAVKEFLLTGM